MGLKDNRSNVVYLRIKEHTYTEDGREKTKYGFATGKDDAPHTALEGLITGMFYRDEDYEGNKLRKLIVVVTDEGINYQFGLNIESSSYSSFISFVKNADISKPISIHPRLDVAIRNGKEVKRRSILISQNDTFAKSYFTKEDPKGLPAWKTVTVSGKNIADKTDYLNFLENFVNTELVPNISSVPEQPRIEAKTDTVDTSKDEDAGLPWMD